MKRFKSKKDIGVGVIGYGGSFNIGNFHLQLAKSAGMQPVAVAELDAERRAAAEVEFPGIKTFKTIASMVKDPDVKLVAVLTPHNLHTQHTLQSLRAGKHVVSEKPFAITTEECDAMIREAKKRKLMLSTFHNRHWDGCAIGAVKQILEKKVIGDVFRVDIRGGGYGKPGDWWRSSKSISGGILYDWGAHMLEYSLQIVDSDIMEVTGFAHTGHWGKQVHWGKDTIEDEASAVIRFKNGVVMSLIISNLESNPKPGMVEFRGTEGTYIMDHAEYELIKFKKGKQVSRKGKNPKSDWGAFYKNIANYMVNGEKLVITPEWARRPIHIMDLAWKSAQQGKALRAKYK